MKEIFFSLRKVACKYSHKRLNVIGGKKGNYTGGEQQTPKF